MSSAAAVRTAPPEHTLAVDDRYIPVRFADLSAALAGEFADPAEFQRLGDLLRDVCDQEAAALERELSDAYAAFDPDCDVCLPGEAERSPEATRRLIDRLTYVLDQGNFEALSDVHIERAIRTANSHGLRVRLNPDQIDFLHLFVRGRGRIQRTIRNWRHPIQGERVELEVFRRLVVMARLRNEPHLLLKMFKDIPECDLEALLPHAEVEMTWMDRALMLGGGAGAMGSTGWKLLNVVTLAFSRLLWIVLFGLVTLIFRLVTGYRRARQNRIAQRTTHLYFQNLSNNSATLHKLVALVAQEEAKEALLAYAFCAQHVTPQHDPLTLRRRIETFLRERFGARVDFDLNDALAGLDRLGLWSQRAALQVLPPGTAVARLEEIWRLRGTSAAHLQARPRETAASGV